MEPFLAYTILYPVTRLFGLMVVHIQYILYKMGYFKYIYYNTPLLNKSMAAALVCHTTDKHKISIHYFRSSKINRRTVVKYLHLFQTRKSLRILAYFKTSLLGYIITYSIIL